MKGLIFIVIVWLSLPIEAAGFDPGTVVFASPENAQWHLWQVKSDGTGLRRLFGPSVEGHSPAVSPDRQEAVYVSGKRRLHIMKVDGSIAEEIPLPKGIYAHPDWSPDGRSIVFARYRVLPRDQREIWRIKRKSGQWLAPELLSAPPPDRSDPMFSPDGKQLAYANFRRDKRLGVVEEIGILDLKSGQFKQITNDRADSYQPVWSPGGDRIVYTSNKAGNYDLWVISLADGRQRRLTRHPAFDGEPAWSPDGRNIVFISTRTGVRELWLISAVRDDRPRQLLRVKKVSKTPFWVK